jgi:hypothetical protein
MPGLELQTDRLKREVGASFVTCDVLRHDVAARNRLVVLSTGTRNQPVHESKAPQTVAHALLSPEGWTPQVAAIDDELAKGKLMGETFRAHNMTVRQNRLFKRRLPLEDKCLADLYQVPPGTLAEVECYEFWADTVLYAVVTEIKNPARTQTPQRPQLGLASFLHSQGVEHSDFITWLDNPASIDAAYYDMVATARKMGKKLGTTLHQKARKLFGEAYHASGI